MLTKLRDNFITGIAVILPAVVTIWLLSVISHGVNENILNPLIKYFKPYFTNIYLEYGARTIVFIALILIVTFIGLATRLIFIRKLFSACESMFFKIPMIGKVYIAIKQMSRVFLGDRKGIFKAPVLVEYPRKGVHSIAFLTSDTKGEIQQKIKQKLVNVFLPTTPNPTSGILLLVPEDEVIYLNMSVEEAMKLVISGGMVVPDEISQSAE